MQTYELRVVPGELGLSTQHLSSGLTRQKGSTLTTTRPLECLCRLVSHRSPRSAPPLAYCGDEKSPSHLNFRVERRHEGDKSMWDRTTEMLKIHVWETNIRYPSDLKPITRRRNLSCREVTHLVKLKTKIKG